MIKLSYLKGYQGLKQCLYLDLKEILKFLMLELQFLNLILYDIVLVTNMLVLSFIIVVNFIIKVIVVVIIIIKVIFNFI